MQVFSKLFYMKVSVKCNYCGKEELVFKSRAGNYKNCSKKCMSLSYMKSCTYKFGDKINNWKIISEVPFRKFGRLYIKVKCTCGSNVEKDLNVDRLEINNYKGCEKCNRFHTHKGHGLISGSFWSLIQNSAKKRNIAFSVSIENAWNLFLSQDKKCALTGIALEFEPNQVHKKGINNRSKRTASLDRINSSIGYVEGNIQWVHKDVNLMKNKFDEGYFKEICKLVCNKK